MVKNFKIEAVNPVQNSYIENSIIDVTNEVDTKIPAMKLTKFSSRVPFWPKRYIRTYWEIKSASSEQRNFYTLFKSKFLKGEYLDLEGNNNYAFILLFDFLNEYDSQKDLRKLEERFKNLGALYVKTETYCQSHLNKKQEAKTGREQVSRSEEQPWYQNYPSPSDWRLGTKLKTKLNLSEVEVRLLNLLWYPNSTFCKVEFCGLEVSKLYLRVLFTMRDKYFEEGTTLEQEFSKVAHLIAEEHFRYQAGDRDFDSFVDKTFYGIINYVFKHCENAVRSCYGYKKRINTTPYYLGNAKVAYETTIVPKITEALSILVSTIEAPDVATEMALYLQSPQRWKQTLQVIITGYHNTEQFVENIVGLARLNEKNPSVKNIFFEATKAISKVDKEAALLLYVHYLYHNLRSQKFENKPLTKTILKRLFESEVQFNDFETLLMELSKDSDLGKALKGVAKIYAVKRKKIQLNTSTISNVQQLDAVTVELLNAYLQDEDEDENSPSNSAKVSSGEVKSDLVQETGEVNSSFYKHNLTFQEIQIAVLELFVTDNFIVPQVKVENFAKSKSVFANPLIESINDSCYEILDDVLIEEEGENYTINPISYQKLVNNDR